MIKELLGMKDSVLVQKFLITIRGQENAKRTEGTSE
jgi:hypothetical protein